MHVKRAYVLVRSSRTKPWDKHRNFRYFKGTNFHLGFSSSNKNVSLRTGEYTWGNRWNTCVKTVMLRYNENQREKNISPLKGVLPQNVLFTLMTLTDSIQSIYGLLKQKWKKFRFITSRGRLWKIHRYLVIRKTYVVHFPLSIFICVKCYLLWFCRKTNDVTQLL